MSSLMSTATAISSSSTAQERRLNMGEILQIFRQRVHFANSADKEMVSDISIDQQHRVCQFLSLFKASFSRYFVTTHTSQHLDYFRVLSNSIKLFTFNPAFSLKKNHYDGLYIVLQGSLEGMAEGKQTLSTSSPLKHDRFAKRTARIFPDVDQLESQPNEARRMHRIMGLVLSLNVIKGNGSSLVNSKEGSPTQPGVSDNIVSPFRKDFDYSHLTSGMTTPPNPSVFFGGAATILERTLDIKPLDRSSTSPNATQKSSSPPSISPLNLLRKSSIFKRSLFGAASRNLHVVAPGDSIDLTDNSLWESTRYSTDISTETICLYISKNSMQRAVKEQLREYNLKRRMLEKVFKDVPSVKINRLAYEMFSRVVYKNKFVYKAGDSTPFDWYLIKSGEVTVQDSFPNKPMRSTATLHETTSVATLPFKNEHKSTAKQQQLMPRARSDSDELQDLCLKPLKKNYINNIPQKRILKLKRPSTVILCSLGEEELFGTEEVMQETQQRAFGVCVTSSFAEFFVIKEDTIRKFLLLERESIAQWTNQKQACFNRQREVHVKVRKAERGDDKEEEKSKQRKEAAATASNLEICEVEDQLSFLQQAKEAAVVILPLSLDRKRRTTALPTASQSAHISQSTKVLKLNLKSMMVTSSSSNAHNTSLEVINPPSSHYFLESASLVRMKTRQCAATKTGEEQYSLQGKDRVCLTSRNGSLSSRESKNLRSHSTHKGRSEQSLHSFTSRVRFDDEVIPPATGKDAAVEANNYYFNSSGCSRYLSNTSSMMAAAENDSNRLMSLRQIKTSIDQKRGIMARCSVLQSDSRGNIQSIFEQPIFDELRAENFRFTQQQRSNSKIMPTEPNNNYNKQSQSIYSSLQSAQSARLLGSTEVYSSSNLIASFEGEVKDRQVVAATGRRLATAHRHEPLARKGAKHQITVIHRPPPPQQQSASRSESFVSNIHMDKKRVQMGSQQRIRSEMNYTGDSQQQQKLRRRQIQADQQLQTLGSSHSSRVKFADKCI